MALFLKVICNLGASAIRVVKASLLFLLFDLSRVMYVMYMLCYNLKPIVTR